MTDLHVVGVHGIWQGRTDSLRLAAEWRAALTRGLTLHLGPDTTVPTVTVPHYSPAFTQPRRRLGPDDASAHEPVDRDEEEFILETLTEYVPPAAATGEDPAVRSADTLGLGLPYLPRPVTAMIARVDRESGRGAGGRLVVLIRQVYKYLNHPERAERIRAQVRDAVAARGTRLVIAHSLGSVVTVDMILRGQIPLADDGREGLTTLVTCGSPLAWPTVRRGIGQADRHLEIPSGIDWVNLYARGDAIARGQGLAAVAPQVRDEEVSNGLAEPHAATRYLDKKPLAKAVAAAMAGPPAN
ncbi:hypothetical protein AB0I39_27885 [Kitasatospora purpeofusca]|uniref:hypothetical protein n=1 Tax=Kitasatospora purpeofusca TaxID=67352 RepID=UPI0033D67099